MCDWLGNNGEKTYYGSVKFYFSICISNKTHKLAYCDWFPRSRLDKKTNLPMICTERPLAEFKVVKVTEVKSKVVFIPYTKVFGSPQRKKQAPQNTFFVLDVKHEFIN